MTHATADAVVVTHGPDADLPDCLAALAPQVRRIVEARSAEKGPFRTLAEGRLDPSTPLTLTLFDDGRAFCRVTMHDWAPQTGLALSPTGGWGVPVNAIELWCLPYDQASMIYFTLARRARYADKVWSYFLSLLTSS